MTPLQTESDWESLPFKANLMPQRVVIWSLNLDVDDECHAALSQLMTERERARAERLQIPLRRRRWIVSRIALRLFTARSINATVHDIHYSYGELGKPALDSRHHPERLSFNNTDSGDLGLIALAMDRDVGIDLERLPRTTRSERITRRRFAAEENAAILGVEEPERNLRFLQCWTRKEAFGKAIGVGIRYPMRDVVLCDNLPAQQRSIEHDGKRWQLSQIQPDDHSVACIVAAGDDYELQCYRFDNDFDRLLRETT